MVHTCIGPSAGAHTLELFKRTEWIFGSTWFYGFQLDQRASIAKASPAKSTGSNSMVILLPAAMQCLIPPGRIGHGTV